VRGAAPFLHPRATIVSATKGIELDTLQRMSQVIEEELGARRPVVVLSGPSFASEVAQQLPTAVLAASTSLAATELVQAEFRGPYFRIYGSTDVTGVELGGALKNVIAIAAGVVEGLGLGHNALAALITRGLAEITRLVVAAGGRRDTPAGLSGLGDLVRTCTGSLSRNRHVGVELARGRRLADVLAGMKMIAEGVNGLLVSPGREEELAAALQRLLGDCDAARRMGAASRRRVVQEFGIDRMLAGYEELFDRLLGG